MSKAILRPREAAEYLGIEWEAFRKQMKRGEIPRVLLSHRIRIPTGALENMMAKNVLDVALRDPRHIVGAFDIVDVPEKAIEFIANQTEDGYEIRHKWVDSPYVVISTSLYWDIDFDSFPFDVVPIGYSRDRDVVVMIRMEGDNGQSSSRAVFEGVSSGKSCEGAGVDGACRGQSSCARNG